MKTPRDLFTRRLLRAVSIALSGAAFLSFPLARGTEFAAVASRASDDYIRTKLSTGGFAPESYAFGKGGFRSGDLRDNSIDKIDFMDVARTIAVPLATQNYLPAKDPNATKLLIMVYWGTTEAPEHASDSAAYQVAHDAGAQLNARGQEMGTNYVSNPQAVFKDPTGAAVDLDNAFTGALTAAAMENRQRDKMNQRNAAMLGYDSWWGATSGAQPGTAAQVRKNDMIQELESRRYFVVLMAYDFQMMWKQKKAKLLWETRFSISEHRNAFDEQLTAMALAASKYFGQDSHGLLHNAVPEGKVELGELKSVGETPAK